MRHVVEQLKDYEVVRLTKENKDFVTSHISGSSTLSNIDNFVNAEGTIAFFVKTENDVLGYIHGYTLPRLQHEPMLYVHNMAVKKKYRHLGIGSNMMEAMKNYAKEEGLSKIFLITNKKNKNAVGLFKKEGGVRPHKDDMVFVWNEIE